MRLEVRLLILFLFLFCCLSYGFGNINDISPIHFVDLCYYIIFICLLSLFKHIPKNNYFIGVIVFVLFSTFVLNYRVVDIRTIKSVVKFLVYSVSTLFIYQLYNDKPDYLLKKYISFCTIIGVVGYIQFIAYFLNISFLYDFSYLGIREPTISNGFIRVSSFTTEPAWMIQILLPVIYLSVGRLFFKDKFSSMFLSGKKMFFFMLLCLISRSSLFVFIIPIFFVSFLIRLNFSKAIKLFIIGAVFFSITIPIIYSYSHSFKYRIDSIGELSLQDKNSSNLSIFALLSNSYVTLKSLSNDPFWGTGMDSHRLDYQKYINEIYGTGEIRLELNSNDAGSFYLRLLSEFGILGFIFLIVIFAKKYKHAKRDNNHFYFLYFFCLIAFSIRNGQYLNPFFQLYFWGILTNYDSEYVQSFNSNGYFTPSSNGSI